MKAKLGKIVKTTKLNYIQLVGDIQCVNIAKYVVQKPKEKSQILENQRFAILSYPVDYLFSNQFMEDLEKIYRLRKYFPSFDD